MVKKVIAITVDYRSTNEVRSLAKRLKSLGIETIKIDNNSENRGFAKAVNMGIKKALDKKADKILLVNPDLNIPKNITSLATENSDITGPVLEFQRNGKKVLDYGGKVNFFLGRASHYENRQPKKEIDYLSGACMMIDSCVFSKIGFFDESYFMYYEDVDFCLRAKKGGFFIRLAQNVIVGHALKEHKVSNDRQKMNYLLKSNKRFIESWAPFYWRPFSFIYLKFLKLSLEK